MVLKKPPPFGLLWYLVHGTLRLHGLTLGLSARFPPGSGTVFHVCFFFVTVVHHHFCLWSGLLAALMSVTVALWAACSIYFLFHGAALGLVVCGLWFAAACFRETYFFETCKWTGYWCHQHEVNAAPPCSYGCCCTQIFPLHLSGWKMPQMSKFRDLFA